MTISLRYAALSDIGRVRKKNQDSGYASARLLVQADGMGGPPAGDLASALTVQTMRRLDEPVAGDLVEALAGAVHRANDRLSEMVESDPSVEGMGTTLDAVLTDGQRIALAHIGDSRAYLLRNGTLTQLTTDHTFVQTLVDEGRITLDEARTHPHRSLMIRALDGRNELEPDIIPLDVRPGDRLMLCSDGLSGFVEDPVIAQLMGSGSVDAAVVGLVRTALDAGSNDNVTCILAEIVDEEFTAPEPLVVGAAAEQLPRGSDTSRHAPIVDDDDTRDPEELRYAPLAPRRFRWLRRVILAAVIVVALVVALTWLYEWSQRQYYVAEQDGEVVIFKGLDGSIAGFDLSEVYEEPVPPLEISELNEAWRGQVEDGIEADSLQDAQQTVENLRDTVTEPPEPTPTPTSPSQTNSPGQSPTSPGGNQTGNQSPTGQRDRNQGGRS
ncbi:MAG: PP2C family protein-serine/threonine phosphatase [Nocardioidaceae bacterium]